jgi:ABC-type phosphate/phosphonate transport system substrate-binding protein
MAMLASLPMYDLEPLRPATDAWWSGIAAALRRRGFGGAPETLAREGGFGDRFAQWADPDLLLSQTCGYPLTHDFADKLRLVATPLYRAEHCAGPRYCSVVVVGKEHRAITIDDLRGGHVAVNGFDSQSGFNSLRALVAPLAQGGRFFGKVSETGRHAASLAMVAAGKADVCAIDCVSHGLWRRHMPELLTGTRVLTVTARAPSLPYVTHAGRSDAEVASMRAALVEAAADPALSEVRDRLLIAGFETLSRAAYDEIDAMEADAIAAGYPELA